MEYMFVYAISRSGGIWAVYDPMYNTRRILVNVKIPGAGCLDMGLTKSGQERNVAV